MGDKPEPKPFPHSCPLGPYANGMEPDVIQVTISGVEKTIYWLDGYPEPPNGVWNCTWYACGVWLANSADWSLVLNYGGGILYLRADNFYSDHGFGGEISLVNEFTIPNDNPFGFMYSQTGQATGNMQLSGVGLPSSWDAAPLVGVPESEGYFAEEFPSIIASRRLRYANHFDGTNVKVYME